MATSSGRPPPVPGFAGRAANFTAVTAGYGANAAHETTRHAVFGEATHRVGKTAVFGRAEIVQVETDVLLNGGDPVSHDALPLKDAVGAFTFGGMRDVGVWRGFEGGFGGSVTLYAVPDRVARDSWQSAGLIPGVLPRPAADRLDGADVEHADVAADGRSPDAVSQ